MAKKTKKKKAAKKTTKKVAKAKPVKKTKAAPKKKKTTKAAPKKKKTTKATKATKATPKKKTTAKAAKAPKRAPVKKAKPKAPKWTESSSAPAEPAQPTPDVGSPAPDFQLTGDDGRDLSLASLAGRPVVLYFYPKADTPGCTREACAFQADLGTFDAMGATVIGVSPDESPALTRFRRKYNLDFPLAGDAGNEVAKRYGVWVEKNMYGRRYMGIQRATFLIGRDGRIAAAWPKVSVEGHSQEVLKALQNAL